MNKLSSTEKKLVVYLSLFVAVICNIFRLLSFRENAIMPHLWRVSFSELIFQFFWNLLFCLALGYITIKADKKVYTSNNAKLLRVILLYVLIFLIGQVGGVNIQKNLFADNMPIKIFRGLYFFRLLTSLVFIVILIRLFFLLEEKKLKQQENEQLRNAYLSAQLDTLKEQLNPHFFFNTLSSLSAVVREDPKKAQLYIAHLSKIFHYSLDVKNKSLVTVRDELAALNSYVQLIKMRFEDNVVIRVQVDDESMRLYLPHMSLQPLIENAIKHNSISATEKLVINILSNNQKALEVSNNIQLLLHTEKSTGIGLANLNERYKILMQQEIIIQKDEQKFTVTLPLKNSA